MKNQVIDKYIKLDISCANVKHFIKELFEDTEYFKFNKIKIHVISFPILSNGYTNIFKWKKICYSTIFVNIYPYLRDERITNRLKWFYVCVTIFHEVRHIELIMERNMEWHYPTYLALLEEKNDITTSIIPKMIQWIIPRNNSSGKIYSTSSVELICIYQSIKKAYDMMSSFLSDEEKESMKMLIKSAKFLMDYMEIAYSYGGIPYNKFNRSVIQVQQLTKKGYNIFEEYLQLRYIYNMDGKIKSIEKIYEERTDENCSFIDCIILQMFINFETDYNFILENNIHLKRHIEFLANQYCENCIYYIENIEIGSVFLRREILDDNALLLLKNVRYINNLMVKYGMVHIGENIFLVE